MNTENQTQEVPQKPEEVVAETNPENTPEEPKSTEKEEVKSEETPQPESMAYL